LFLESICGLFIAIIIILVEPVTKKTQPSPSRLTDNMRLLPRASAWKFTKSVLVFFRYCAPRTVPLPGPVV